MVKFRSLLHVALALTLLSLTCDLGAVCAFAGMAGCCCPMEEMGAHCDISGSSDLPAAPVPATAIEAGERFCVAVLDAAPSVAAAGGPSSTSSAPLPAAPSAEATPLYLSHCAFLC